MNTKCQWHQRPWQTGCPCRADGTEIYQKYTPKLCCSTHQNQGLCSSSLLESWNTAVHEKCDCKVKGGEGRRCKSLSWLNRGQGGRLTQSKYMTSTTNSWVTWCYKFVKFCSQHCLLICLFILSLRPAIHKWGYPCSPACVKVPSLFFTVWSGHFISNCCCCKILLDDRTCVLSEHKGH